jgi:hypothetical protein
LTEPVYSLEIDPIWGIVVDVKEKIRDVFNNLDPDVVESLQIVGSELLENAIKYGVAHKNQKRVTFELMKGVDEVSIVVKNGVASDEIAKDLIQFLDQLIHSENKKDLYLQRLKEIFENPLAGTSRLGLYRILCDTEFDLSYSYMDHCMTIVAKKKLS